VRQILVTGHSRGIGQAVSKMLLAAGHQVIGISRTSSEPDANLAQYKCDLSDAAATARTGKQLANEFNIDAVVLNAGAGRFGALENFSAEQIEEQLQLNLVCPLILLRSFLPSLKKHTQSHIVFIGSESALHGGRFGSVYSAAKFGLRGAAQALRHECASANCRVGIVNPGMVRTGFFDELNFEPGPDSNHALNPDDVAEAVISMLNTTGSAVIDEIVVNPLQRVVQKKKSD